jgi:hypothetical protein
MNKQFAKGKFTQVLRSDRKTCTLGTYWTPCCVSSNEKIIQIWAVKQARLFSEVARHTKIYIRYNILVSRKMSYLASFWSSINQLLLYLQTCP